MNTVPERIGRAVDVVDPGPADRLLEFGCGPRRRNADHVRSGRLDVRECALTDLRLPPGGLDAPFGVNVNVFWTGPDRVTATVAEHVRSSGFTEVEIVRSPHGAGVTGIVG